MWKVGKILFLLVLAGCSGSGDWFARPEPRPEPIVNEAAPQAGSGSSAAPQSAPGNLSPAARAAAQDSASAQGELLDCVSDSCKVNCSPKVPKQYRPKWCARFKEPEQ
jgi:hypothetical protein